MEIAFVLIIAWAIITLVGHSSWVVVRGLFRLIANFGQPPAPPSMQKRSRESDFDTARRMIRRMRNEQRISDQTAIEMLRQLRETEFGTPILRHPAADEADAQKASPSTASPAASVPPAIVPTARVTGQPIPPTTGEEPPATPRPAAPIPAAPIPVEHRAVEHVPFGPQVPPDVARHAVVREVDERPPVTATLVEPTSTDSVAGKPVLSPSEVIQSFLSAHNIRWGELVAGVLIVVCSIGLVISLWSPLVETHPVVPSLIFLGATSAIYAAGLYTLARWRLRHTSRAVLVIATLLVPLSVLAGLAAAGTRPDAVQLNDPITLIAIAAAGLVYAVVLYLGAKALSRSSHALPQVMAVAGPVITLPLVPAVVRNFSEDAGWLIAIGSASVFAATVLMNRLRSPVATSIGPAGGRVRLLVMAFGGFSLAVAIAYIAFSLRDYDKLAMLPLAIASIPAIVAFAGMSRVLMLKARSSTLSMTAAVMLVLFVGLTWIILPPSMVSPSWLWMWALSLGLSVAAVGFLFRQPTWLALATLPIGVAAVLTSKVWVAGHDWSVDALWTRLISGEAMIASLLMAFVSGASVWAFSFWPTSQSERRRAMERAAIGWGGLTFAIATILSFAPIRLLGVVPAWVVTLVLLVSVLVSFLYSLRDHRSAYAATLAATFTWLSMLRPETWLAMDAVPDWMLLASSIAATLLVMREVSRWLASRRSPQVQQTADRAGQWWVLAANGFAIVAAVAAVVGVDTDWTASALTLSAVALFALWASSINGSVATLRGSQLATVALAGVIGYARFGAWLLGPAAWSSGKAMWGWAIAAGLVATLWWLIRELARYLVNRHRLLSQPPNLPQQELPVGESPLQESPLQESSVLSQQVSFIPNRIGRLISPATEPTVMPDGWVASLSTVMVGLAAGYFFAVLAIRVGTNNLSVYESSWGLPLIAMAIAGLVGRTMRRHESKGKLSFWLTASVMITAIVWLACQLAGLLPLDASGRLIAATTLAAASFVGFKLWLERQQTIDRGSAFRVASLIVTVLLVGVASTALLQADWLEPILNHKLADRSSTIAVALWWLASSLGLLWRSKQVAQPLGGTASVVLFSAASAIVVPAFSSTPPQVWGQVAALAAMIWIGLTRWKRDDENRTSLQGVIDGTFSLVMLLGVITSVAVTASIVLDLDLTNPALGSAGFLLSVVSSIALCSKSLRRFLGISQSVGCFVSWPVGVSLLAGQIAWLFHMLDWVGGVHVVETLVAVWVASAIAALWTYRRSSSVIDFAHVSGVAVVSTVLAILMGLRSEWMQWLALASLVAAGVQVALVGIDSEAGRARATFARLLGWFVGVAGVFLLATKFANQREVNQIWTMIPLWLASWVVLWRLVSRESAVEPGQRWRFALAVPDLEFGSFVMLAAIVETFFFAAAGRVDRIPPVISDPLLWARIVAYGLASGSAVFHASRNLVWTTTIGTLVAIASLTTVRVAIDLDASYTQRFAWGALSSGFAIAFLAHWLPGVSRLLGRITHVSPNQYFGGLVQATWQSSAVVALLGVIVSIGMIAYMAPAADAQLAIAAVALASWAIAEMAEESNLSRLRYTAVGVGLASIGLWASVDGGATGHPMLAGSMRWLVASVLLIPMMLFVIPKLLGQNAADRWRDALRMGIKVVAATALGSLTSMLTMEYVLRDAQGVSGVPLTIVVGVAITLATLSVLSGLIAMASGPTSKMRERLNLSDSQRVGLIGAAQAIGVLTWLHVFLCQPDWAFAGLRAYWPYTVMALAFLTVGITEWARRRGDEVMSRTLKQTALYLPLIPVLGFWLSGAINRFEWAFAGGQVRYDVLLVLGTIYYIAIASLWKGVMPRVAAIVLGNAAWWVVLTQWPGWEFLSHPQLWLIPPAVCVLVVAQLYSNRLDARVLSAIRYASTLVIYISSTADMLIQQIGTTLAGPIVLILIALAGMLAGVVLRVRPFLYLGAAFVFLGVTSMVWHAQRVTHSVWPWWAFGISTGLCLLVGLMALEKYKPQLREYAKQLASWEE